MRILQILVTMSLIPTGSGSAFCQDNGGPLGDPIPPAIKDPSLSSSPYFPPSLTHAGVADTGPALDLSKRDWRANGCNLKNPCALPTPALDHVVAARAG